MLQKITIKKKKHNTIIKPKELHNNSLTLMESYTSEQRGLPHSHLLYPSSLKELCVKCKGTKKEKDQSKARLCPH